MKLQNTFNPLLKGDPNLIILSETSVLSRRRARKLAHQYRGSRRGKRYAEFAANGHVAGYWSRNNRLIRLPKIGQTVFTTVHSGDVINRMKELAQSGSIFAMSDLNSLKSACDGDANAVFENTNIKVVCKLAHP